MQKISGSATSVHVGCFTADYTLCVAKDPEKIPKYTATGVAASMLSNRISLFYNISGPSLTVDTACSSSLVALDLACRSLRQGESTMVRQYYLLPQYTQCTAAHCNQGNCCWQQPTLRSRLFHESFQSRLSFSRWSVPFL